MTYSDTGLPLSYYGTGANANNLDISKLSDNEFQNLVNKNKVSNQRWGQLNPQSSSTSSSSDSNNLTGTAALDDATARAKDLATFKLGQDESQSQFNQGLTETQAQNDFGRSTKATDQTYGWQDKINNETQAAQTARLQDQLNATATQQNTDIAQQNLSTNRAINLASRRLGSN